METTRDKVIRMILEEMDSKIEASEIQDDTKLFEDLEIEKCDLCVIDSYPQADIEEIIKKAEKIADNVLII